MGKNLLLGALIVAIIGSVFKANSDRQLKISSPAPGQFQPANVAPLENTVPIKKGKKGKNPKVSKAQIGYELYPKVKPSMYEAPTKKSVAPESKYDCGDHNGNQLYRGPRGGCYYINSSGNKTYVSRDECNC